jgi:hypothetical protein
VLLNAYLVSFPAHVLANASLARSYRDADLSLPIRAQ